MIRFVPGLSLLLVTAAACSSNTEPATSNGPLTAAATTTEATTANPPGSISGAPGPGGTVTPGVTTTAAPTSVGVPSGLGTESASSTDAVSPASVATSNETSGSAPGAPSSEGNSNGATTEENETATTGGVSSEAGATTDANGDPIRPRSLDVTATKGRHEHRFRAKDADSTVSYNDNDQIAIFDNRAATLMGKLVLTFGGAGETKGNLTGAGEFCAQRGFHVLAVAAFQAYNIVDYGPEFYGLARRTVFEGVMHTKQDAFASITLTPADGVAQRTQKALQYLHATYPDEDWGYFLQEDGSVRWSDVIFTGVSHGASNSARFASLVRASRVVAVAGPRDNLCARVDLNDCGGDVATWYDEEHLTPIDRYYTITGVQDDQHTQHLFAMEKLGYAGDATRVDSAQPPYGDSHRLVHGGGHDDVCANQSFQNLCNYAFGVPAENHAGTGP